MQNFLAAELRRLGNTVKWSLEGWLAAWATEKSLRQWTIVMLLSDALTFAFHMSPAERGLLFALAMLVVAAELMNTAVEEVVDYLSKDHDPRAKKAKDCGTAAVAVTALAGGVAWVVILIG